MLDLLAKMMPDLAREISKPLASIDKLTVVDTGNGQGAGRLTNTVAQLMATTPELVKGITGVDLGEMASRLTAERGDSPSASGDGAPSVTPSLPASGTEADPAA